MAGRCGWKAYRQGKYVGTVVADMGSSVYTSGRWIITPGYNGEFLIPSDGSQIRYPYEKERTREEFRRTVVGIQNGNIAT